MSQWYVIYGYLRYEEHFSASQVHQFYTSKTEAICPLTHPLTLLMIAPKDYESSYVF